MLKVRRSKERGATKTPWLYGLHSFSFGEYRDMAHMGFASLRVINEDVVAPSGGFPTHPHRDMEIVTYILSGALEHQDSMGNTSIIQRGDIQRMSAGTGVLHSEFNHSKQEPVHLLQIWFLPEEKGITPSYAQKHFSDADKTGKLCLLASRDARQGSIALHQDVDIYASILAKDQSLSFSPSPARKQWLQLAKGSVEVNTLLLNTGDGLAISEETALTIHSMEDAEYVLFDMA